MTAQEWLETRPPSGTAAEYLDIVYPVRPGDDNDELRYSLRTLEANYPHGQIWIVGHQPNWLTNINHIPGNRHPYRQGNIYHNILTACRHPDTPQQFAIFNDDFFITEPIIEIPTVYRGTLTDHIELPRLKNNPTGWWAQSLRTTLVCLQASPDCPTRLNPISYELHVPFIINKQAMAQTLQRFTHIAPENPPQWRSLYGNLNNIGGYQHPDCKMSRPGEIRTPFHSTDDASWRRHYATHFKAKYPNPSKYEKP
ncbi:hypothetical protein [Mycobacterium marinum]|uniref:hypothetical protein n=1 Tax=Mycobacterium marinum TaxID=1781 RepID=UPI000B9602C2|nr:hypothetical protein [Mycobacterium marinum]